MMSTKEMTSKIVPRRVSSLNFELLLHFCHLCSSFNKLRISTYMRVNVKCTDPERFVRGGPNLTFYLFFYFFKLIGREDPNTTISGQSSARHRWRFAGVLMMAKN